MKSRIKKLTAGILSAVMLSAAMPVQDVSAAVSASKLEQFRAKIYNAWNTGQSTVALSSLRMPFSDVADAYYEMLYTDAEWFFVSSSFRYGLSLSGTYVATLQVEYSIDTSEIPARKEEFSAGVMRILSGVQDSWSDAEKVLYLHDYLAEYCSYDLTYQNMDAYTAIVNGSTICQGYALAMCVLCRELDIPCYTITSDELNHMWNIVQIDGKWYHLDVTYDDSAPDMLGHAVHDYVLQSDAAMYTDEYHHADDWNHFSNGNEIVCDSDLYADAFWRGASDTVEWLDDGSNVYAVSVDPDDVRTGADVKATIYRRMPDGTVTPLKIVSGAWQSGAGYVYPISYVSTQVYNDLIYFHTADSIYAMTLDGDNTELVYTLSNAEKKQGSIYGMVIDDDGLLTYQIMPTAYYADDNLQMDTRFGTLQLEKTEPTVETTTTTIITTTTTTTVPVTTTAMTTTTTTRPAATTVRPATTTAVPATTTAHLTTTTARPATTTARPATTTASPTTTTARPATTTARPATTTARPATTTVRPATTTARPATTTARPATTTARPTTTTARPVTTTARPATTTVSPATTTAVPATTTALPTTAVQTTTVPVPTTTTVSETTTVTTTETVPEPLEITLAGDVNLDGEIDVVDVVLLACYLVERPDAVVTKQGKLNADLNGNGSPDQEDITLILKIIAKL